MEEKNILSDLVKFVTQVEQVIKIQDSFSKEYVTNKDLQKIVQGFAKQTELFANWMNKSKKTTETLVAKEVDKLVWMLNETSKRLSKITNDKGLAFEVKIEALKGEMQNYVDTIKSSTIWEIEEIKEQLQAKLEQEDIQWLIDKSNETIIDDENKWNDKTYSSNKIETLVSEKIKQLPQRQDGAGWSPVFIKDANRDRGFANVLKFVGTTVDIVNNETVVTVTWWSGSWDVVWPASAVDNNFASFDTTTGKLIQDSWYSSSSFAPALTSDQNYVTDAQLVVLWNTSWANTGDQNLSGLVPYTGATANLDLWINIILSPTRRATTSAGMIIESANGTDIWLLWAWNTANITWYGSHNYNTATQDTIAIFTGVWKTLWSATTATYPSLTELSYVKWVTSDIQTQLNSMAVLTGKLRFAIAGTIGVTGTNVANTILITESITLTKCHLCLGTAGNGTLTVDVNKNGTTLFSTTKPSITTTNQYSVNTGTLTTTTASSGDLLTIDIDQVQATTKGIDLYVELEYTI